MFKDGDVICLLGDSITASGFWGAEIYQTIGATTDVKFFNCGVSGNTADRATKYLYHYCLAKNPDYVTVMFGVNDIDRGKLSASYTGTDAREKVAEAVARHAEKTEQIINEIIAYGATPILCTAPPYDEYNERETENLKCDYALEECAENVRALAKKYNCPLIDFREEMLKIMLSHAPIGPDRVHPNLRGYHMMAQIFLEQIGFIDEKNYDSEFVLEEWNVKRREAEISLKRLDYIDYNRCFDKAIANDWGEAEKIADCRAFLETSTAVTPFMRECSEFYIENARKRQAFTDELVKCSIYPRKQ